MDTPNEYALGTALTVLTAAVSKVPVWGTAVALTSSALMGGVQIHAARQMAVRGRTLSATGIISREAAEQLDADLKWAVGVALLNLAAAVVGARFAKSSRWVSTAQKLSTVLRKPFHRLVPVIVQAAHR